MQALYPRYRILNAGSRILDLGCTILDAGSGILQTFAEARMIVPKIRKTIAKLEKHPQSTQRQFWNDFPGLYKDISREFPDGNER